MQINPCKQKSEKKGVQPPNSMSWPPDAGSQFWLGYHVQMVTVMETESQRLDCWPELTPLVHDVLQLSLKTSPTATPRRITVCHRLSSQSIAWLLRFLPYLSQTYSHNPEF